MEKVSMLSHKVSDSVYSLEDNREIIIKWETKAKQVENGKMAYHFCCLDILLYSIAYGECKQKQYPKYCMEVMPKWHVPLYAQKLQNQ